MTLRRTAQGLVVFASALFACGAQAQAPFTLEEASIAGIHRAIRSGQTTCTEVVQGYIARARAYNGVCTALVTEDGEPIRAAAARCAPARRSKFPTRTVALSSLVPDFDKYKGKTPDCGRMEPTASDPSVQQQYGMVVGIPNAGQVNALETLNMRGERSVTCKGDFDAHPSKGPLPAGAPAECEEFRKHARRARARSGARRDIRHEFRRGSHAAVLRAACRSRRSTTPRTCARPAAAT